MVQEEQGVGVHGKLAALLMTLVICGAVLCPHQAVHPAAAEELSLAAPKGDAVQFPGDAGISARYRMLPAAHPGLPATLGVVFDAERRIEWVRLFAEIDHTLLIVPMRPGRRPGTYTVRIPTPVDSLNLRFQLSYADGPLMFSSSSRSVMHCDSDDADNAREEALLQYLQEAIPRIEEISP